MNRRALIALLALLSFPLAAGPASAERIMQLALPSQQPDSPPPRPVGDPDSPPVSLELFDIGSSQEEAWPWPSSSDEN
jgi:hypothetical protein